MRLKDATCLNSVEAAAVSFSESRPRLRNPLRECRRAQDRDNPYRKDGSWASPPKWEQVKSEYRYRQAGEETKESATQRRHSAAVPWPVSLLRKIADNGARQERGQAHQRPPQREPGRKHSSRIAKDRFVGKSRRSTWSVCPRPPDWDGTRGSY